MGSRACAQEEPEALYSHLIRSGLVRSGLVRSGLVRSGLLRSGGDPARIITTDFFFSTRDAGSIARSRSTATRNCPRSLVVSTSTCQRFALPTAPLMAALSFSIHASSAFSATTG